MIANLVDEAILREWLVSMGSRPATQRLAHLFCEMMVRTRAAGIASDNGYPLPLTQEELGESMGLSAVHTNRSLRKMIDNGWLSFRKKQVTIHDWRALAAYAEFNPGYLHMTLPDDAV